MNQCPKCGNTQIWGREYSYDSPQYYDGISEWWCNPAVGGCGYRQGRWTGQELHDGEIESIYGAAGVIKLPASRASEDETKH